MIRHVNELLKMNPRTVLLFVLMFVVVALAATVFRYGGAVVDLIESQVGMSDRFQEVQERLNVDRRALQSLSQLLDSTEADRASIYMFHNGKTAVNSVPFMFYSQTHEVARRGVSRDIMDTQSIPISTISPWTYYLLDGRCFVGDVSQIGDPVLESLWFSRGVDHIAMCPLAAAGGIPFGFVTAQWNEGSPRPHALTADRELRAAAINLVITMSPRTRFILDTQRLVSAAPPAR